MCAHVGPYMVAGGFVSFIIRGVGLAPYADVLVPDVVDARRYFDVDNAFPAAGDIALLHAATTEIIEKAKALPSGLPVAPRLYVQCREGRSRSARCVGAYLMKYHSMNRQQALAALQAGYNNPVDGCAQQLNADAVDNWLMQL